MSRVLEGVNQRLSQRLQADLQADADYRTKQSEVYSKILLDQDATPEARERAYNDLKKLYPQSKNLLDRVKDVTGKVFSAVLKPPPVVEDTARAKTSELIGQAERDAQSIDPAILETYSGLAPSLPPPPSMSQAQPQPTAPRTMASGPQAQIINGQAVPTNVRTTVPSGTATMSPPPALPPPPTTPPPSTAGDITTMLQTKATRTMQEEVDKEKRIAETARETARIASERTHAQNLEGKFADRDIAREADAEQSRLRKGEVAADERPYTATGNIVLNTKTGQWEQLPIQARTDTNLGLVEVAAMAADPSHPQQAQMKEALRLLREQNPPSDTSILLNQLRALQLDEKTAVSPGQVINRATGRPVNLTTGEAVLLKDLKFLQDQTDFVTGLLDKAGDTGAIKGWVTVAGMTLPVVQDVALLQDPVQVELAAEIQRLNNAYVYAMTGKQINENETVRLALTAPNIRYTPETNRAMVRNFGRAANSTVGSFMEVNGWTFAPGGVRGAASVGGQGAGAGAGAPSGNNALPPPPTGGAGAGARGATPTPTTGKATPGSILNFNGRTYVIQPDGSAVEKK